MFELSCEVCFSTSLEDIFCLVFFYVVQITLSSLRPKFNFNYLTLDNDDFIDFTFQGKELECFSNKGFSIS